MNKILFVYTANRCRSPMAERLFLRLLKKQEAFDIANWMVSSAGTWAESDIAPDENLITVLDAYDNTIRNHRIQAVTKPMLATQNLVLVMARHHLEALRFENPELGGKIYLLSQITGKEFDIEDPFDKSLQDYQQTAQLIDEILTQGFTKILQLMQDGEQSRYT